MSQIESQKDQCLAELLSEYVDLMAVGAAPPIERYLEERPELAEELRPLLQVCANVSEEAREIQPRDMTDEAFQKVNAKFRAARRESIESGQGAVAITHRPDLLLLLIRAAGQIWGKTRVIKYVFLLGKETSAAETVPDYFNCMAYDYGPFDDAVYRDLDGLSGAGLVKADKPRQSTEKEKAVDAVYQLTPRGKKYADALSKAAQSSHPGVIEEIEGIVQKYRRKPLKELLRYVYQRYPEYAKASKIKDEVLSDDES